MGMNVRRGDILWADIEPEAGIKKTRAVLIIQNDMGNKYSNMTIVAAIRHDSGKELPIHVTIPKGVAQLTKDSIIDCGILATIDKVRLKNLVGHLPQEYIRRVDKALKISLQVD